MFIYPLIQQIPLLNLLAKIQNILCSLFQMSLSICKDRLVLGGAVSLGSARPTQKT